jgi:hypothetical protein
MSLVPTESEESDEVLVTTTIFTSVSPIKGDLIRVEEVSVG